MPSVLISGASIAGPALAYWLGRSGFEVTVLERAPAPRTGGQAIDVRGPALDVIKRMALLADVQSARTHHKGMSVLDASGRELFRTTERTATAGRFDSGDIEIFRDDLSRLLVNAGDGTADYRYGDTITELRQDDAAVHVTFATAPPRAFDIVVGADGLHSRTRRLAVAAEETQALIPVGVGFAIFTTPNILNLEDWQLSFRDETSGFAIYPTLDNAKLRTSLGFELMPEDMPHGDFGAEVALIRSRCAHMQGAIPTLLDNLTEQSDLWFGPLAQIRLDGWSKGRIALVGDAAYCPSPLTGQGTSLALVGAYVLAKELERSPETPADAFMRYEARMRPFVRLNQDLLSLEGPKPVPDDIFDHAKNAIDLSDYGHPAAL
ncbi:MAG: FAD-dependent monooxygenase [Rhodospirillales bacterium]|nr:FAD-dependent monooxygenase [Rhodospirillales bacterium]